MSDEQQKWEVYVQSETARVQPVLGHLGFTLDNEQQQTLGERYLTRPLGGARKLVLFGRSADGMRVVIKTSNESAGVAELEHEQTCREVLNTIQFAHGVFASPKEILFDRKNGIAITEYIEQEKSFLERPIEEQFAIALNALKAQEGAHATTAGHSKIVERTFGEMCASDYYKTAQRYVEEIRNGFDKALTLLNGNHGTLDRYGGFLTHWDFTPQNFRIRDGQLYLLDHASLRFGNKYEGWARFINFMVLYNPLLAEALIAYVRNNRTDEESLSLKLMRVYRLLEIIHYYTTWLPRTDGNLNLLAQTRITFWSKVLELVINDRPIPAETIEDYQRERDALRSDEEKKRQIGLH